MEEQNYHSNGESRRINIPAIDLRSFCQDELLLAAELSGHFPEARFPNLIIPALDKNFFNTSLASRKQTYRRRPRRPSAASQRQSRPLPLKYKARLLLQSKKAKQTLKANSKKTLKLYCNGLSTDKASLLGAERLGNRSPQSTSLKERSGKSVADTESLLGSSRPMENRSSEATDQSQDQVLNPVAKRMRLKEGARNRVMFKKQGGYGTLQGNGCQGAADSQQVSKSELMDLSLSQDLQNPKRGPEIAMGGGLESCKKEVMGLDAVGGETAMLDYLSKTWVSRHMEKKTLVARGFPMGSEFTDGFRRPSTLDELEFSNHERRDFRWTSHLV